MRFEGKQAIQICSQMLQLFLRPYPASPIFTGVQLTMQLSVTIQQEYNQQYLYLHEYLYSGTSHNGPSQERPPTNIIDNGYGMD